MSKWKNLRFEKVLSSIAWLNLLSSLGNLASFSGYRRRVSQKNEVLNLVKNVEFQLAVWNKGLSLGIIHYPVVEG